MQFVGYYKDKKFYIHCFIDISDVAIKTAKMKLCFNFVKYEPGKYIKNNRGLAYNLKRRDLEKVIGKWNGCSVNKYARKYYRNIEQGEVWKEFEILKRKGFKLDKLSEEVISELIIKTL